MALALIGVFFFGYQILSHLINYAVSNAAYANLRAQVKVISAATSGPEAAGREYDPPIDMEKLSEINPDTVGWLRVGDTVIDYPVVQGADNDYYLRRSFDGTRSDNGCLFLDVRNRSTFEDSNHLIYGHNMRNGSMFGSLDSFRKREFLESHAEIEFFGIYEGFNLVPFAIYVAESTGDYLLCEFASGQMFEAWIDAALAKSELSLNLRPEAGQRVMTLVSCITGASGLRIVMHLIMEPQ